jgi:hypothetical protein
MSASRITQPDGAAPTYEELDFRATDGVEVSLLWDRSCDSVFVAVLDERCGWYFEVPVQEGQSALEVFRDPFAYRSKSSAPRGGH